MKKELLKFIKNKFNLAIVILQTLAFIFLALTSLWELAIIFVLLLEGGVFITIGIKTFYQNKVLDNNNEMYKRIGLDDNNENADKKLKIAKKSNVFQGILYICMGLAIIFIALF